MSKPHHHSWTETSLCFLWTCFSIPLFLSCPLSFQSGRWREAPHLWRKQSALDFSQTHTLILNASHYCVTASIEKFLIKIAISFYLFKRKQHLFRPAVWTPANPSLWFSIASLQTPLKIMFLSEWRYETSQLDRHSAAVLHLRKTPIYITEILIYRKRHLANNPLQINWLFYPWTSGILWNH